MQNSITEEKEVYSAELHTTLTKEQFNGLSAMKEEMSEDTDLGERVSAFLKE